MKFKYLPQVIALLALLFSFVPVKASPLAATTPPVDMFQWPWTQGESWIAMDGFDNGTRRLSSSPHNYKMGGAVDFAPHVNMKIGEDTSNFWVTAAAAGTVFETSSCHMKIDHGNGWITEYWHLDNIQVAKGVAVYRNQRLAVIADSKYQHVCLGNEFPGPHLHFVMRPKMIDTVFSGWSIKYNVITNVTTFVKNGQTLGSYKPILNVPALQIVLRDAITWNIVYTGTVDAYRYEKWPFQLSEATKFTVTAAPTTSGLTPLIVLLDANGNEITRATGTLTSAQPAGSYFVQIQPEAGNGFYTLLLTKGDPSEITPTPTSTSTTPTSTTPTSTTPTSTTPTPVTPTSTTPTSTTPTSTTPTSTTPTSTTPTSTTPTSTTPTSTTPTSTTPTSTTPTSTTPTPVTPTSTTPTLTTPTSTTPTPITPTSTPIPTPTEPYVSTVIIPTSINTGEVVSVSVNLNNVPFDGYTSTEFTCTYNPALIEARNIMVANLFGFDAAAAMNGPQNGSFIVAIAGSNGNKATTSGTAFTFSVTGLQAGQTAVECKARVLNGDKVLYSILYIGDSLTVAGNTSPETPTPTPMPTARSLAGQVIASKPITIRLYNVDNSIAAELPANADGTFYLTAPAGNYTVTAAADGFLGAQGAVTLIDGVARTMSTVSLVAGDINNNSVIDQFDAMTIGMSYNTSIPPAADLNNDGLINVLDLELLARNYRKSGAIAWQ